MYKRQVPEHIQKKAFAEYGETLEGAAEAIWQFNKAVSYTHLLGVWVFCQGEWKLTQTVDETSGDVSARRNAVSYTHLYSPAITFGILCISAAISVNELK